MAIILPKTEQIAQDTRVSKLVLVSHQGTGKTTALSKLPSCLLLDYENGSKQVGGLVVNLIEQANSEGISLLKAHFDTVEAIKKANQEAGKFVYKYLGVDNITALEKLARTKATIDFKNSIVGKGMMNKGAIVTDVVTDVPEAGWLWYAKAWDDVYMSLQGLVSDCIIFLAHSKQSSMMKDGIKLEASDMQLTGKAKLDLLRDVDACGTMYKKDNNTVMLSFKTNERDLTIKSRASHLTDTEFIFSQKDEKGNITVNWNKIFLK